MNLYNNQNGKTKVGGLNQVPSHQRGGIGRHEKHVVCTNMEGRTNAHNFVRPVTSAGQPTVNKENCNVNKTIATGLKVKSMTYMENQDGQENSDKNRAEISISDMSEIDCCDYANHNQSLSSVETARNVHQPSHSRLRGISETSSTGSFKRLSISGTSPHSRGKSRNVSFNDDENICEDIVDKMSKSQIYIGTKRRSVSSRRTSLSLISTPRNITRRRSMNEKQVLELWTTERQTSKGLDADDDVFENNQIAKNFTAKWLSYRRRRSSTRDIRRKSSHNDVVKGKYRTHVSKETFVDVYPNLAYRMV